MNCTFDDPEELNYLIHYGVKGMKWGVRRYQNDDGSLTPNGRKHYGYGDGKISDLVKKYKNKKKMQKVREAKAKKAEEAIKAKEQEEAAKKPVDMSNKKFTDKKKDIKNLSDTELKNRVDRLENEKRYKQLLNETRNDNKALLKKLVTNIGYDALKDVGTKALKSVLTSVVANAIGGEAKDMMLNDGNKNQQKKPQQTTQQKNPAAAQKKPTTGQKKPIVDDELKKDVKDIAKTIVNEYHYHVAQEHDNRQVNTTNQTINYSDGTSKNRTTNSNSTDLMVIDPNQLQEIRNGLRKRRRR